jgi:tetratricopeptide (TPR) repeat protein
MACERGDARDDRGAVILGRAACAALSRDTDARFFGTLRAVNAGRAAKFAWLMGAALCLAHRAAHAQTARNEALVQGSALLEAMNAAAAIPLLERATREGAGPLAHFNLGLAYRAVGRYREAIEAWDAYLSAPERDAPAERLSAVRTERAELEQRCLRVELRWSPTSARVFVDDREQASARGGQTSLLLDASARRIELRAADHRPWSAALLGRAGTVRFDVTLQRTPAVTPIASAPRLPWWAWMGVGIAAASAITAASLAADGQRIYSDCAATPSACAADRQQVQAALDARSTAIGVSAGVGAAGLVTLGVALTVTFAIQPARR